MMTLLPEQDWQQYTKALITELLEDGTNPDTYHTIEHHFASENFEALEKLAIAAFKQGLEVAEPEEAQLEDGTPIFAFDIITEQLLDVDIILEEVRKMSYLAKDYQVEYDGWGTYFEE